MWKLLPLSVYWLPFVLVTYPSYLPSTFKLGPKVRARLLRVQSGV